MEGAKRRQWTATDAKHQVETLHDGGDFSKRVRQARYEEMYGGLIRQEDGPS